MFQQRQLRISKVSYSIMVYLNQLSSLPFDDIVNGYLKTDLFALIQQSITYNNPVAPKALPSVQQFMRLRTIKNKPWSDPVWDLFVSNDVQEHLEFFESFNTYLVQLCESNNHACTSQEDVINKIKKRRTIKLPKGTTSSTEETLNTNDKTVTQKRTKKATIPATVKRLVWNKHIGEETGKAKCMCCKVTDITQMSFNCGHIVSEKNGGDVKVNNLLPVCQNCNTSMGTMNMGEFKEKHGI